MEFPCRLLLEISKTRIVLAAFSLEISWELDFSVTACKKTGNSHDVSLHLTLELQSSLAPHTVREWLTHM